MTRVAAFVFLAGSFAVPAIAEVTHLGASRRVFASYGARGQAPATQTMITTEVGSWEGDARVRSAGATQRSSILPTSVELSNSMGSATGGGFEGIAESSLIWDFQIDTTMRWDATYQYEYNPSRGILGGASNYSLTRAGEPTDYFSSLIWRRGNPNTAEGYGYIEPGIYRLTFDNIDRGASTRDRTTFALSVPTPGSLAVFGLVAFAWRRNRLA